MALSVDTLSAMSTPTLMALRKDYIQKRINLPKQQGRLHIPNLVTDLRSISDSIRTITQVLQSRQRRRRPLDTFAT